MSCNTLLSRFLGPPPTGRGSVGALTAIRIWDFDGSPSRQNFQAKHFAGKSMTRRWFGLFVVIAVALAGRGTPAQEILHFPSLDAQHTMLDGYLYRPAGDGRHPAMVFLHGCGGMIGRKTGAINPREADWAARFNALGYVVLMVDSLTPRHHGEMCSIEGHDEGILLQRPLDAYGALTWLQAQPFVRADRVGIMGWSEGGGVVLSSVAIPSRGRPATMTGPDFRVAVAFYPGSCSAARMGDSWTTRTPLLVLNGDADVWTPLSPCQALMTAAVSRGAPVTFQGYPGAYHDFDWPNLERKEHPEYRTRRGVVPIAGTDPSARADALQCVPAFLAGYLNR
jgi:dienelactone hydrolase